MYNSIDQALKGLGADIGTSVNSLSSSIDSFNAQNLTPQDIIQGVNKFPRTVGGVFPEIGAQIPEVGRIPLPIPPIGGAIGKAIGIYDTVFQGAAGEWQSTKYAADLNRHHPKLKFLFKVAFTGFGVRDFYYFVHRCDKPKVRFVHQDVNYYNFRTRVLTQTTFEPLTIQFLDEIGNSVHDFFAHYTAMHSGQGRGGAGIHTGFGPATSSIPYKNGYSSGEMITVEQIFANGSSSNRFRFINPRIESFDFDELNMEESAGSMLSTTFSYDAMICETVANSTIYSWGQTDLLRAGGTSGPENAGSTSGVGSGNSSSYAPSGMGLNTGGSSLTKQMDVSYKNAISGMNLLNQIPGALSDIVGSGFPGVVPFNNASVISSGMDTISSNIQGTLNTIKSGNSMNIASSTRNISRSISSMIGGKFP